ncbi:tetratricopeptide repeat protein [Achromobacter xylosoxidans]|jgi:hypothetical protein|uniref:tetratricopeptide repeat protein n=1 Tax=Alcaligenes xylosoxydans xylosoxydans TaxID=85698 RepID=UPI0006C50E39|nr:tetratricopeptide repeat protein [Achromobacter xylosoxidans]CUI42790.1 Predicted O-linked N-acetylglucosamine transferase%2C SPINDLY family [Achromobacter xylosoxidans]
MSQLKSVISFATRWGAHFGGINSFNTDLLTAFAAAFAQRISTICVVLNATEQEAAHAKACQIQLISLDMPDQQGFPSSIQEHMWLELEKVLGSDFDNSVWLGHDRITGGVALAARRKYGGRAAVAHHMSYGHYESFAENSSAAHAKIRDQNKIFSDADIVMAVGPLLRDALAELLDRHEIPMLIPGLPDIPVKIIKKTFRGFISGRLSQDAKKIKQGHLGVAAFSGAIKCADTDPGLPTILRGASEPELTLRGVDFEECNGPGHADAESEIRMFAEKHAGRVFRMHTLPFTTDRDELFDDLRKSSVAMMPSWHEGFGLVGWEAIAAGVPLIASQKSGLYRLLEEIDDGLYASLVYPVDVSGAMSEPYYQSIDLERVTRHIIDIAKSPDQAHGKAIRLREALLQKYRWRDCAHEFAEIIGGASNIGVVIPPVEAVHEDAVQIGTLKDNKKNGVLDVPGAIWKINAGLSTSRLLRAEESVIPFDSDRAPFLQEQIEWANSVDYPLAIRLLTGVGGAGKTRLAMELCRRLKDQQWEAGFLPNDSKADVVARELLNAEANVCLIVDYAETRQQTLMELIKIVQVSKFDYLFRIVLLARAGGEWWGILPSRDSACEAVLSGMATTGPYCLPELHNNLQRRQAAFQYAMNAFAEKLSVNPGLGLPNLEGEHFGHPLYVQMAALLVLQGEQPGSAEAVTRSLINHERRYWAKALSSPAAIHTPQDENPAVFMALATLVNGFSTVHEAEILWRAVKADRNLLRPLFETLCQLYPGRQGVEGLRPDLLGEALVAQCLLGVHGATILNAIFSSGKPAWRRHSLTVLARMLRNREELSSLVEPIIIQQFLVCLEDLVAVIVETPSPLARITERAFSRLSIAQKSQASGMLNKYAEDEIFPLVDLMVLVGRSDLERVSRKSGKLTTDQTARKAAILNNLSVRLLWQGGFEESTDLAKQAEQLYAALAATKPESFKANWASALNNYSNRLSKLGRFQEAEKKAKQALDIRKNLATASPELGEHVYANVLVNYSLRLNDLKKYGEAERYIEKAINIFENYKYYRSEDFEKDWAGALSNYANILNESGRRNDAEVKAKLGLEIYEKLAKAWPSRFEAGWATSLSNYASFINDLGRSEDAEEISRQSLSILERLARAKPERFEGDWSAALSTYANLLSEEGKMAEAEVVVLQSLQIRERLASARPEQFEPLLAGTLNNYSNYLMEMGRNGEAEVILNRVLCMYENLDAVHPNRFKVDAAIARNNFAVVLSNLGRMEEAEIVAKETVDIYENVSLDNPGRYEADLAASLTNHANRLIDLGAVGEAVIKIKRAEDIYRKHVEVWPLKFEFDFLMAGIVKSLFVWLDSKESNELEFPHPIFSTPRQKKSLEFMGCFLKIFTSSDRDFIRKELATARLCVQSMDSQQKRKELSNFLLLESLSEKLGEAAFFVSNWRDELAHFSLLRGGRIPWWMLEISRRRCLGL